MKRLILSLLIAFAAIASCVPIPKAQAQVASQPQQVAFALTQAGQRIPTITFNGPTSTCAVVIYSDGGGFTLVPQVASDGQGNLTPTWVTASNINSGSIAASGTFVGNVASQGLTAFGGLLSALSGAGPVTGVVSCSGALSASAGGGGGSSPSPGWYAQDGSGNIKTNCQTNCTPNPTIPQTINIGATPLPVNANAAPTCSPTPSTLAGGQCGMLVGPSTEPVTRNGNVAVIDANGNQAMYLCANQTTVCVAPTATASAAGYAVPFHLPVQSQESCVNQAAASVGAAGNSYQIGCAGTHGSVIASSVCNPVIDGASGCAVTGTNTGDGVSPSANTWLRTDSTLRLLDSGAANYVRARQAVSPAPPGTLAVGWNENVNAAPVVCDQQAIVTGTTINSTTLALASVSGKKIYICSFHMTVAGTVGYQIGIQYGTKTTNPCDTGNTELFTLWGAANDHMDFGDGVGTVGIAPAGNMLCTLGSGTTAHWSIYINYVQI